jgi:glucan endo-1,3-beta-D-glucosidase
MTKLSKLLSFAFSLAPAAGKIYTGFNYGAFWGGPPDIAKTFDDFRHGFNLAKNLTSAVPFDSARLFTCKVHGTDEPSGAFDAAVETKTNLLLGFWISGGSETKTIDAIIAAEMSALAKGFEKHGQALADLVIGLSVGSEDVERSAGDKPLEGMPKTVVETAIKKVKQDIASSSFANYMKDKPIGHVDTAKHVVVEGADFYGMTAYPYWNGDPITNSQASFTESFEGLKQRAGNTPIWIGEMGWPSNGPQLGQSMASTGNLQTFWNEVGCHVIGKYTTFWFELVKDTTKEQPDWAMLDVVTNEPRINLSCPGAPKPSPPKPDPPKPDLPKPSPSAASGSSSAPTASESSSPAAASSEAPKPSPPVASGSSSPADTSSQAPATQTSGLPKSTHKRASRTHRTRHVRTTVMVKVERSAASRPGSRKNTTHVTTTVMVTVQPTPLPTESPTPEEGEEEEEVMDEAEEEEVKGEGEEGEEEGEGAGEEAIDEVEASPSEEGEEDAVTIPTSTKSVKPSTSTSRSRSRSIKHTTLDASDEAPAQETAAPEERDSSNDTPWCVTVADVAGDGVYASVDGHPAGPDGECTPPPTYTGLPYGGSQTPAPKSSAKPKPKASATPLVAKSSSMEAAVSTSAQETPEVPLASSSAVSESSNAASMPVSSATPLIPSSAPASIPTDSSTPAAAPPAGETSSFLATSIAFFL